MGFFIQCWDVVKEDLMNTFQNFHSQELFEKSFNATYVALIPKKAGAMELKDYRPISLITSLYKIISKVLTKRLKTVIHKLVDTQQMAFIKGREIMDADLIANECVDSRVKSKIPRILGKLDIETAYDHINWNYLLKILKNMGFGRKWIKWIGFCISTVKFSILVNGSPERFFSSQRGLRQGDPLSSFLFIIVMEGLNSMIKKANQERLLRGFKAVNNVSSNLDITHMLYADVNWSCLRATCQLE